MGLLSKKKQKGSIGGLMESLVDKGLKLASKKLDQAKLLPELIRKADRAAYMLHEIGQGNEKAIQMAETSSKELSEVLKEMGIKLDWK